MAYIVAECMKLEAVCLHCGYFLVAVLHSTGVLYITLCSEYLNYLVCENCIELTLGFKVSPIVEFNPEVLVVVSLNPRLLPNILCVVILSNIWNSSLGSCCT